MDYITIQQRMNLGHNYWIDTDRFIYIDCSNLTIEISIFSRKLLTPVKQVVGVEEFNEKLVDKPPICGLTCTKFGLLWSELTPLRYNELNYFPMNFASEMLSHKKSLEKAQMRHHFLPEYKTADEIRSDILHGRTLGGALDRRFGLAVNQEGVPSVFFGRLQIGQFFPEKKRLEVWETGWSYFKGLGDLVGPDFAVEQGKVA